MLKIKLYFLENLFIITKSRLFHSICILSDEFLNSSLKTFWQILISSRSLISIFRNLNLGVSPLDLLRDCQRPKSRFLLA